MNKFILIGVAAAALTSARAQDDASKPAASSDVESLRQQVQALTETVKELQQQMKDQQAAIEKANGTAPASSPNPEGSPVAAATSPSPPARAAAHFATEDASVVSSTTTSPPASSGPGVNANGTATSGSFPTTDTSVVSSAPETVSSTGAGASFTQPISIGGGGKNYMNISFDGLFALAGSSARDLDHIEVGDHDPQQRGFNARNIELAFDGAVDPYFEGFANIVFKLDNDNETDVEVEEAFMQTTSLPFNLQLKAGQFFAAFGRLNPTHPHTWDFADTPLVNGLFLGPDGLRGVGAQGSWTLPLPWYSQLIFASQNGRGSTGFPFMKWQTEFMYRRFQAGHGADDSFPVAETFHDWGLYSQVLWGFKKGWVAGIRGDYVHMQDSMFTDDLDRQSRWRLSANLTWYPTEFSKIRLQYNQDFLEENFFLSAREVESIFLQWEFILGSHGAHKF